MDKKECEEKAFQRRRFNEFHNYVLVSVYAILTFIENEIKLTKKFTGKNNGQIYGLQNAKFMLIKRIQEELFGIMARGGKQEICCNKAVGKSLFV